MLDKRGSNDPEKSLMHIRTDKNRGNCPSALIRKARKLRAFSFPLITTLSVPEMVFPQHFLFLSFTAIFLFVHCHGASMVINRNNNFTFFKNVLN